MTTEPSYTAAATDAVRTAAAAEHDFGGWLSRARGRRARARGSEALVAGRPGSWEAEHVRRLAKARGDRVAHPGRGLAAASDAF